MCYSHLHYFRSVRSGLHFPKRHGSLGDSCQNNVACVADTSNTHNRQESSTGAVTGQKVAQAVESRRCYVGCSKTQHLTWHPAVPVQSVKQTQVSLNDPSEMQTHKACRQKEVLCTSSTTSPACLLLIVFPISPQHCGRDPSRTVAPGRIRSMPLNSPREQIF